MAKFRIVWHHTSNQNGHKDVEADHFDDASDGRWIDFRAAHGPTLLRVRADDVESIEVQPD